MLMLQVRLRAADGRQEALIAAVHRMAAVTRGEEGCLRYDFYRDTEQSDGFLFVEEYRDEAALREHLASAHFAEYRAATQGLVVSREATRYDVTATTRL